MPMPERLFADLERTLHGWLRIGVAAFVAVEQRQVVQHAPDFRMNKAMNFFGNRQALLQQGLRVVKAPLLFVNEGKIV